MAGKVTPLGHKKVGKQHPKPKVGKAFGGLLKKAKHAKGPPIAPGVSEVLPRSTAKPPPFAAGVPRGTASGPRRVALGATEAKQARDAEAVASAVHARQRASLGIFTTQFSSALGNDGRKTFGDGMAEQRINQPLHASGKSPFTYGSSKF